MKENPNRKKFTVDNTMKKHQTRQNVNSIKRNFKVND